MQFLLRSAMIDQYVLNIDGRNYSGISRWTHQYSHLTYASYFYQIFQFPRVIYFYDSDNKYYY